MVRYLTFNQNDVGSIPTKSTMKSVTRHSSVVERGIVVASVYTHISWGRWFESG